MGKPEGGVISLNKRNNTLRSKLEAKQAKESEEREEKAEGARGGRGGRGRGFMMRGMNP